MMSHFSMDIFFLKIYSRDGAVIFQKHNRYLLHEKTTNGSKSKFILSCKN